MKYYFIDPLGESDPELVILDSTPEGMGVSYCELALGEPATHDFPADACMHMAPNRSGLKIESLLGNTQSFLMVARAVKEVIERHCQGAPIEYLPFSLINHRGHVHSRDYFFVNPIGSLDCLDLDKSSISYWRGRKDKILSVERFVLDPAKLISAPALFRIKEWPGQYVINEAMAKEFLAKRFSNIKLKEIEVSAG